MKRLNTLFIAAVLLVSTLSLTNANFGNAQTGLVTIINTNTTWTKTQSPISLTGPVLLQNGATLTIEPGVTVNFNGYYLTINGTLRAFGSNSDKIQFNGGEIRFTEFSTSWNEQTSSGNLIQNAAINSTTFLESSAKIDNCIINTQSIKSLIILNSKIVGNVNGPNINGNTITGDVSGTGVISNNNVTGTVTATGSCIVSKNYITGGGVVCSGTSQIVENTITGCSSGVAAGGGFFQDGGYPVVKGNLITNNTQGVTISTYIRAWVGNSYPTIFDNTITKNSIGVWYSFGRQDQGNSPTINITNNNIYDNTQFNLYLTSYETYLNTTCNWWGSTNQQTINMTIHDYKYDINIAKAEFTPYLTAPNPSAPTSLPTPTPNPSSSPSTAPSDAIPEYPISTPFAVLATAGLTAAATVIVKKRKAAFPAKMGF